MNVYFISGLGADRRVFRHIVLPEGHKAIFLDWIMPKPKETLYHYSVRMAEDIDASKPFALIGLSMGGMVASEISCILSPSKTILISSSPVAGHLPPYFAYAAKLNLHKIVPVSAVKFSAASKRLFSAETNEDKQLIKQLIKESDPAFIKWAMDAILNWKGQAMPTNLVHIHGTKDEVLPIRYVKPTHVIKGAGHMLVMANATRVNEIIAETFY